MIIGKGHYRMTTHGGAILAALRYLLRKVFFKKIK